MPHHSPELFNEFVIANHRSGAYDAVWVDGLAVFFYRENNDIEGWRACLRSATAFAQIDHEFSDMAVSLLKKGQPIDGQLIHSRLRGKFYIDSVNHQICNGGYGSVVIVKMQSSGEVSVEMK